MIDCNSAAWLAIISFKAIMPIEVAMAAFCWMARFDAREEVGEDAPGQVTLQIDFNYLLRDPELINEMFPLNGGFTVAAITCRQTLLNNC